MSIPIIRLFREDWIKNWKKPQANKYRLNNTDLKHIQNFNSAIKRNSFGGYYINYDNRKKLVNGLKALNKASNAIQYFNNFPPNHRQGMAHTLRYYIFSTRKNYKNTRQRMIDEFKKRKTRAYASKFKEYPSKVRGWNKTIRAPVGNEPFVLIPGVNGQVAKTPWTVYLRNRMTQEKRQPNSLKPKIPNSPIPKIPRNFGLWLGPYKNSNSNNKYYQSPNMKLKYYPKRNVLVTNQLAYRHASKKFTLLPRNEWM